MTLEPKKILSRADFLSANQRLRRELVDAPLLGGAVYLRELTTKQKLDFNTHLEELKRDHEEMTPADSLDLTARIVAASACDENGELLFTQDDVAAISENNPLAMMDLSAKAMELSGLGSAAIDEVKAEIKKATSGDSATT